MKIAFDVLGTLDGFHQAKVLALYRALQNRGHEMFVWSSEYSMAIRINEKLNLNAEVLSKFSKSEISGTDQEPMDIAIDDDSTQTWLGAKYILLVRDIRGDIEELADKLVNTRSGV